MNWNSNYLNVVIITIVVMEVFPVAPIPHHLMLNEVESSHQLVILTGDDDPT